MSRLKTITISGSHANVGKTKLAEKLFKILNGWSGLKVTVMHNGKCPTGRDCGACNELDSEFSIINNKNVLNEKGKDTQRFINAGAKKVLWLKARPHGLRKGLKKAMSMLKGAHGLIIEGTSVLKYIEPDLAILVKKKGSILKPSAKEMLNKMDLVITV
jgi:molybdopterin-guanine dinucleotide biosynthesis protein